MASTPLNEWKAIADYHRTQLALAETKVKELSPPVEERLSYAEMKKRVIALETRKGYKKAWKNAVDDGLIENIENIINDCRSFLVTKEASNGDELFLAKAKKLLGRGASWLTLQLFTLRVIEYLKKEGSFDDEEDGFDTFEDTAGGCDEITQDAAVHVINQSE